MACHRRCPSVWPSHAYLCWLTKVNTPPVRIISAALVFHTVFMGVNTLIDGRTDSRLSWLFLGSATICVLPVVVPKFCGQQPQLQIAVYLLATALYCVSNLAVIVLSGDLPFRMRGSAFVTYGTKAAPAILGIPLIPSGSFILGSLLLDASIMEVCRRLHGDPSYLRMHLTNSSIALMWFGIAWLASSRMHLIFNAQGALAAEKKLMESIIDMLCDAVVWLSEDSALVLHSDQRLQQMLGRSLLGEYLGAALPEEEQQRLKDCLARAKMEPAQLPTTLLTTKGQKIPVELFIVANRDVKTTGQASTVPAFLVGLRVASEQQGMETFQEVSIRREHRALLEQSQAALEAGSPRPILIDDMRSTMSPVQSVPQSIPETTGTGRVFEQVDVRRRQLTDIAEQEEKSVTTSDALEKVKVLGQQEHWLLSARDLDLDGASVLGEGAFGRVLGGWLHGSAVAVKTLKHRSDRKTASDLASISNEIRILRHVRHPNVVLFHGACVEPSKGRMLLVVEQVRGPELFDYITSHSGDSDARCRLQLLLDVACALRFLHAQDPKVVHGDLKCSNVLVEPAMPRAKLVDFGLSRLVTRNTLPMGGTLTWAPPENIVRSSEHVPRPSADVFCFGRLAYAIIACKRPLQGIRQRVIVEMAKKRAMPTLIWPEDKPLKSECMQLCEKALCFTPENRPSMTELHQEALAWELPESAVAATTSATSGPQVHAPTAAEVAPKGHTVIAVEGAREGQAGRRGHGRARSQRREASPCGADRADTAATEPNQLQAELAVGVERQEERKPRLERQQEELLPSPALGPSPREEQQHDARSRALRCSL